MEIEKLETLNTAIKATITILGLVAGVIGAFFNQRMIKANVKEERNRIPKEEYGNRIIMWFRMHTTAWWVFIIVSILIVPISLIQDWVDGKIQTYKNNAWEERQAKRDSLLHATYLQQMQILDNQNKQHIENLIEISNQRSDKNKDELSTQIGSIKNHSGIPDLGIVPSYGDAYQEAKRKMPNEDVMMCLINNGSGRAYNVNFTMRQIRKIKGQKTYKLVDEMSVFNNSQTIEIAGNEDAFCNGVEIMDKSSMEDTCFYILNVEYQDKDGKEYNLSQLFGYIISIDFFTQWLPGKGSELDIFLRRNGYTHY